MTIPNDINLLEAAEKGDLKQVKKCFKSFFRKKTVNINIIDNNNNSPLILAAKNGHTEIVKILIEHKANVNTQNISHTTPLMSAVTFGDYETTKILLEHSAQTELTDYQNNTALHIAAAHNRTDILRLLLEHHANINAIGEHNYTPLIKAIECNRIENVEILAKNGADLEHKTSGNQNALHLAIIKDKPQIVKILIENNANIEVLDADNLSPLVLSVKYNCVEITKYLIKNGALVFCLPEELDMLIRHAKECFYLPMQEVLEKAQKHPEAYMKVGRKHLRKKLNRMSPAQLLSLPKTEPNLIKLILFAKELETLTSQLTYDQQRSLYKKICPVLTPEDDVSFRNIILKTRQHQKQRDKSI